jgi:hypothetical protein
MIGESPYFVDRYSQNHIILKEIASRFSIDLYRPNTSPFLQECRNMWITHFDEASSFGPGESAAVDTAVK